jgi:mRNA interferase RelE/StbE
MTSKEGKFILKVPDDVVSVLKKLHPVIKSHIRSGLRKILEDPYSGKALKDELKGLRSCRVKRYRIIYRIQPKMRHIEIVVIGPRKIIYEETFRILARDQNS